MAPCPTGNTVSCVLICFLILIYHSYTAFSYPHAIYGPLPDRGINNSGGGYDNDEYEEEEEEEDGEDNIGDGNDREGRGGGRIWALPRQADLSPLGKGSVDIKRRVTTTKLFSCRHPSPFTFKSLFSHFSIPPYLIFSHLPFLSHL